MMMMEGGKEGWMEGWVMVDETGQHQTKEPQRVDGRMGDGGCDFQHGSHNDNRLVPLHVKIEVRINLSSHMNENRFHF
jgi:hypothetical protein